MILTSTLTIIRPVRDRYGDRTSSTTHTIDECVVVPATSTEDYGAGADQVSLTLTVIAYQGADVLPGDAVQVPDYTGEFQVVGQPLRYPVSPGSYGVAIKLTQVTG